MSATRVAVIYNEPKSDPAEEHWIWKSDSESRIAKDGFYDASEYGVLDEVRLIGADREAADRPDGVPRDLAQRDHRIARGRQHCSQ